MVGSSACIAWAPAQPKVSVKPTTATPNKRFVFILASSFPASGPRPRSFFSLVGGPFLRMRSTAIRDFALWRFSHCGQAGAVGGSAEGGSRSFIKQLFFHYIFLSARRARGFLARRISVHAPPLRVS